MAEFFQYGMTAIAGLLMLLGGYLMFWPTDNGPPFVSTEPAARGLAIAEHQLGLLAAIADEISGAVLISGAFVGICLIWF